MCFIMATNSDTGDTSKSLLVCLGERKRPISLSSNASFNDLRLEVVEAFRDVLPCSSNATTQDIASSLIVQVKSEGTFLDLNEIPASK